MRAHLSARSLADPVWTEVVALAEKAISESQIELERRGAGEIATEFHRGRISAMRSVLALNTVESGPVSARDDDAPERRPPVAY